MKKKFILFPLVGILLYLVLSSYSSGPGLSGGLERTGASGFAGCSGIGCHSSVATPEITLTVQLLDGGSPVTSYLPSHAYTIRITGTQTSGSLSLPKFGFQVAVVKTSTTTNAGTLSAISGTHTASAGGINLVEHSSALTATSGLGGIGTTYVKDIPWTSPVAGTGCVTIFTTLNAVDGAGGADAGDKWNNTSLMITEPTAPITGTTSVCVGSTTTLSDASPGGTWASGNVAIATVGTSGIVTGVAGGTVAINYTTTCGGTVSTTVTVNSLPTAIFGVNVVCVGSTTTLSDITPGGTWSSVSPTIATVGTSGIVTGILAGTSVISYTVPVTGCAATTVVTVNPLPTTITGTLSVCPTFTTTLNSTPAGGTWTSSNGNVTIGSSSGVATGVNPGTSIITYTTTAGCSRTATVTVNTVPTAITGTLTMCPSLTTTLNSTPSGGSWSSASPGIATVGLSTGIVTGVAPAGGTSVITYTGPSGCSVTATVTVNPSPGSITGTAEVCPGATTTLTDGGGGTWTSGSPGIATIGSSSGLVTGIAPAGGTTLITYTLPVTGCTATRTVTVDPNPSPISGTLTVCPGNTTTLSDAGGGTWLSSAPAIASIDFFTGVVSGVSAGTTTITYTLPGTGCTTTAVVTVNPAPVSPGGPTSVCVGSTATLTATGGGTWLSSNTGIATIGSSSGIVSGVSAGVTTITYTLPVTGCFITMPFTVNPLPGAISGTPNVCVGSSRTLTDAGGGTWTSSDISIATVGSSSGTVTGVSAGVINITYTLPGTGCLVSTPFTVNALPAVITGTLNVCAGGNTTTLSDATAGGTWTSSNTSVATIGSSSGIATSGIAGTTTITYTLSTGCVKTAILTVNALPSSISGPASLCAGASVTLSDGGGGTWISSNPGVATIGSSSGTVTGVSGGTTVITYTLGTGCFITRTETVNPAPAAISGASSVCVGQTTPLTDAGGGTWTSSSGTATVGSLTGIVTGISPGTTTITYTLPVTSCFTTKPMTVNALSAIIGLTSMCSGTTTTLTNATPGGTWASSNTAAATIGSSSGFVNAIAPGTTIITYTLPSGCVATSTLNVISAPAPISGTAQVCIGATTTLTDAGGGTWSSGSPAIATVGSSSGIVTGVAVGVANITYSLGTGCNAFLPVTVNANPAAIGGTASACVGATTTLTESSTGNWTSSNTAIATVPLGPSTSGVVTGVSAGTAVITFTVPASGCIATRPITINPLPAAISGSLNVCLGSTTPLTDGTPGGTWTSSAPATASVGSLTGVMGGISLGTATISYTLTGTGCRITAPVTVNPLPLAIGGTASACVGSGTLLTDATPGGTWTSANTAIATVGSSTGLVVGVSAGTTNITYTLSTGCFAIKVVTINSLPATIGGITSVCVGSSTTLTDGTSGGTWSSGNPAVATVGSTTGVVTGVSAGTVTITYTVTTTGCATTTIVTVNPLPSAIGGTAIACVGATTTLTDATGGGTWSSGSPAIATIGSSSGIASGVAAGLSVISYTLGTGCRVTKIVTINPLPATISGTTNVCVGSTTTLTDAGGGSWSSSDPSVATVGTGTGVVTGVGIGTATITYTLPTGCLTTIIITVNPLPSAITGVTNVCVSGTTTLSDATAGGVWSSSNTGIATIGSTSGLVLGISAGTVTITYTLSTGCTATTDLTVNPLPSAISGPSVVCATATITLTDGGGGTWASSNTAIATIGTTSGTVTGVAAGTATITYTLPTGCTATTIITVNPQPVAGTITGTSSVCATNTILLADTAPGGVWSSSNTSLATVGTSGVVTGIGAGVDTIKYSVTNSCGTDVAIKLVTVNPLPDAGTISGVANVCVGATITLSDAAPGGTWSSSNANATVGGLTGVVTGVATGTSTITYTVTNGCGTDTATQGITIITVLSAGTVVGPDSVCEGATITLSDAETGGAWSSSGAGATVGSTGVVTGVSAGAITITYSMTNSCGTTTATHGVVVRSHADCNVGVQVVPGIASDMRVYPNPSDGTFTIELPGAQTDATITIMDVLGKVVETRTVLAGNGAKQLFNLHNVASGSYVVKVNVGNKVYRDKIVIR
jgi:trimeric autotransporter adhesin